MRYEKGENVIEASKDDRTTVGLSQSSYALMERLKLEGYFDDMADCYKFALGLAIRRGLDPLQAGNKKTYTNIGSLDKDFMIRDLMAEMYPDAGGVDRPVAVIEQLAEAGMQELSVMVSAGGFKISEVIT